MQQLQQHERQQPSAAAQEAAAAAAARQTKAACDATGNVENWWMSESSEDEGDQEQDISSSEDADEGKPRAKQQAQRGQRQQQQQQQADPEESLYDPDADDSDEQWVQQQRQGHTTDAILSCPGCFTTVCVDCQQHAVYHTQYRAMLTMNCEVKMDEVMHSEVQQQQQQQRRKRRAPDNDAQQQQQQQQQGVEVLHPVCCAVCDTQVGAQDADEVVHFFHVLASES